MNNFKVNDWCFFEFKLSQIMEMDKDSIVEISDSMFRCSGRDLNDRCVPLSLWNCNISMNFQLMNDKIHREGSNNLNYPDIHRYLVERWVAACKCEPDKDACQKIIEESNKFVWEILEQCHNLNRLSVQGVPLFRPKLGG